MNSHMPIARLLRLLEALGLLAAMAACGTQRVEPRPAGWPVPNQVALDCKDVLGRYIDPSVSSSSVGLNMAQGGIELWRDKVESASYVFGLHVEDPRFDNIYRGRLTFTITRSAADIIVSFQIDNQTVASNAIPESRWKCTKQGLTLTVQENDRATFDKAPGHVSTRQEVTVYRVGEALYARSTAIGVGRVYDAIPWHSEEVCWNHYQSAP